ncbi:MAG: macro domain-containing protein [Clostridiales bacterium]|nr:macro domain-containing protein [Clostridiales bacterium]
MPFHIVRNDITRMQVDAVVNAANKRLSNGSGVNGAVHRAAGPELLAECQTLGGCRPGEVKVTRGYKLPCRYVIHTVGPVWRGGLFGEQEKLSACYRNALQIARKLGCKSVAFPLISSGAHGYPADRSLKVAMNVIGAFLLETDVDMMVYLVLFNSETVQIGKKLFDGIRQYIDDRYVEGHLLPRREQMYCASTEVQGRLKERPDSALTASCVQENILNDAEPAAAASLEAALEQVDESFSQMVLRKIKERGMKNAECYKKANLDKKLFSKINNDIHYKPKKTTALALAVALELSLDETRELLMKAGLALSHSDKFDIIVEYFIKKHQYDIFEINEVLFYYDQPLLGCSML